MFLSTLFLCISCTSTSDKTTDSGVIAEFIPTMPISECGLPEYTFLPTTHMGEILAAEKREDLSLSQETITALRSNYDLPLPEPTHGISTYYIEYTSQDKGEEKPATGMVIFPEGKDNADVIVWLHPTMGFADACSPTATGIIGAAYPAVLASLGYIVVAPDYFGMRGWRGTSTDIHPYVIAEPTAISSIDAIRALPKVIDMFNIPIKFDAQRISLWGASEGGYAALITDRYMPHYAPEFTTIATIASTPVTDVFMLAQHGVDVLGPTSGGVLAAQVSMYQWYGKEADLNSLLHEDIALVVEDTMLQSCDDFAILDNVTEVNQVFTDTYVQGILANDGSADPWACYLKDNSLQTRVPRLQTAPTLIITAELDALAWPDPVHHDIPGLCTEGYAIEHIQCAGLSHVPGSIQSLGMQWDWLQNALSGNPYTSCVVSVPQVCGE